MKKGKLIVMGYIGQSPVYSVIEDGEFIPQVNYKIINDKFNVSINAYSDKNKEELHSFIEKNKDVGFTIKDELGNTIGLLEPQFLKGCTILYNEI